MGRRLCEMPHVPATLGRICDETGLRGKLLKASGLQSRNVLSAGPVGPKRAEPWHTARLQSPTCAIVHRKATICRERVNNSGLNNQRRSPAWRSLSGSVDHESLDSCLSVSLRPPKVAGLARLSAHRCARHSRCCGRASRNCGPVSRFGGGGSPNGVSDTGSRSRCPIVIGCLPPEVEPDRRTAAFVDAVPDDSVGSEDVGVRSRSHGSSKRRSGGRGPERRPPIRATPDNARGTRRPMRPWLAHRALSYP